MSKEALKLALEALEVANSCVDGYYIPKGKTHLPEIELAITAIKKALANEALDKMAENARELGLDYYVPCCTDQTCPKCKAALEAKDEPVAIVAEIYMSRYTIEWTNGDLPEGTKLYTTTPQRTWVGLTDEDKSEICDMTERDERDSVMRLVEAKLKARNI